MTDKFTVEIISPEKLILNSEVSEVIIPSYEGQMGILKDHIPLITFLRPGVISIKNQDEKNFFVEEGTVEFSNNKLLILTSTAKNLETLNKSLVESMIRETEVKINKEDIDDKKNYLLSYKISALKEINK